MVFVIWTFGFLSSFDLSSFIRQDAGTQFLHRLHQGNRILHGGLLVDAVAQVEDVPRSAAGLIEHVFHAATDFIRTGQQNRRIKIALNGLVVANRLPGVVEANPPVDPDHVTTRLPAAPEEAPGYPSQSGSPVCRGAGFR